MFKTGLPTKLADAQLRPHPPTVALFVIRVCEVYFFLKLQKIRTYKTIDAFTYAPVETILLVRSYSLHQISAIKIHFLKCINLSYFAQI